MLKQVEIFKFKPGDKVTFDPKDPQEVLPLDGSMPLGEHGGWAYKGQEFIVSQVIGYTKKGIAQFCHFPKGKFDYTKRTKSPLYMQIELEEAEEPYDAELFKRRNNERFSEYTIEEIIQQGIETFSPREYLLEMIDKKYNYNMYNLPLQDYIWYLDKELANIKEGSVAKFEEELEYRLEEDEEGFDDTYNYQQELELFFQDIQKRKKFFQGTRNVCEVLATKYKITTYGELIRSFAQNRIKLSYINWFFTNGWLDKKEFQFGINEGYTHAYPIEKFDDYQG